MRIAVLIFGILGALAAGFLGMTWISDYNENKELIDSLGQLAQDSAALAELEQLMTAAYILLGSMVLGLIGSVLAFLRKGRIAAGLMIVGALAPVIFAPKALIFTFLLLLAGAASFFVKPKPSPAGNTQLSSYSH